MKYIIYSMSLQSHYESIRYFFKKNTSTYIHTYTHTHSLSLSLSLSLPQLFTFFFVSIYLPVPFVLLFIQKGRTKWNFTNYEAAIDFTFTSWITFTLSLTQNNSYNFQLINSAHYSLILPLWIWWKIIIISN